MNQKKVYKRKAKNRNAAVLLASLIMVLAVGVGGTIAYLVANTSPVTNTFTMGAVPPHIVEKFDGESKEYVKVKNEGTADAYIRAKVVVTWQDSDGNVYGSAPVKDKDYTMRIPGDNWVLGDDGYYYYENVVAANTLIEDPLLTEGKVLETAEKPEGYNLSVEILAQSVQADGMGTVTENGETIEKKPVLIAWGTWGTEANGSVLSIKDDADRSLNIRTTTNEQ